jgi:hypothetical protein
MSTVIEDLPLDLPPALVFTDDAARKVGSLIEAEGNPSLMLRVFVRRRIAVRHPQSERHHDLRLRVLVLRLNPYGRRPVLP